jgi:hypothetical protein
MVYCKTCGTKLTEGKCKHCGADYSDNRPREMKHKIKRNIKSRFYVPPVTKTVILVVIIALVILVSYLAFSTPQQRSNSLAVLQQDFNSNASKLVNAVSTETQNLKETVSKPNLRVYHQMVNQLGLNEGCFGRVDGGVTNLGGEQAYDVTIFCTTDDGVSVQKDLGTLKPLETKTFQVLLNYECDRMHTEECSANCNNC